MAFRLVRWQTVASRYVTLGLIFGVVMVFLVPPFQVADEPDHYLRATSISQGQVFCDGNSLRVRAENAYLVAAMDPDKVKHLAEKRFDESRVLTYTESDQSEITGIPSAVCRVFPLSYIPSAVGVFLADIVSDNELIGFYAGRVGSLLCSVALVAFSLYLLPGGKNTLAWVALLPMSVFQFSSFNYDALFIPCIFLFVSITWYLSHRNEAPSGWQILALLLLAVIITNTKVAFTPIFLFSCILIFRNKKERLRNIIIVLSLLVTIVLTIVAGKSFSSVVLSSTVANPSQQLDFITGNSMTYVGILLNTVVNYGVFYVSSIIGTLGWLDYQLPNGAYIISGLGGIALWVSESVRIRISKHFLMVIAGAVLASVAGIFTGMYLYASPPRWHTIEGVQGRYLLPLVFPVLLIFQGFLPRVKENKIRRYLEYGGWAGVTVVLCFTVISTYLRYYGP